jgi:hypothetical protein
MVRGLFDLAGAVGRLIVCAPVLAMIAAVIVDRSSAASLQGPFSKGRPSDPARFAIWLAARVPESVW